MMMPRRTKLLVGLAVIVSAVVIVGGGRYAVSRYRDERVRQEMHAKARALKDEIDRQFPAGTRQSDFTAFAKLHRAMRTVQDDYYISIGKEPSRVWYCGPWDVGVVAHFEADRLASTTVTTWGFFNCP